LGRNEVLYERPTDESTISYRTAFELMTSGGLDRRL